MTNYKKAYLYSPLLGGAFSGILFCIYSVFITSEQLKKQGIFSLVELFANAITIFPILIFINVIIFYALAIPLLKFFIMIKDKYFLKNGHFWALMFFTGLVIGIIISLYFYSVQPLLGRSIVIIIGLSFGLMFTSSFFSVITEEKLQRKL